ncbi:sodium/potassium-transporting ATPase subunit beta-1 [Lingula anatina]|uniref:Sodium/potassium-transporting ATPase subunit beta-1 n=1 Tax=Lingula anatina TaxID=7574 RepID=A0A1S3JN98_LINAN|nr:sodium/potassium-transporting ATPase subunit beta-1 [Lingula anatina]|eukprot:XP_013411848.1 sodium/potassium-transporting ATPase subunit beta-1 [Lingula anatina]
MVYGNAGAIGNNPGLSFRPMPWAKSTMIYFVQGDKQSFAPIIANIRAHLIQYENQNQDGRNYIQCGYGVRPREKVCTFNLDLLGPCIWKEEYGYNDGEPCVILKLNKLYGWEPEPYDNNTRPPELGDRWRPDHVGVTCEGDTDTDKENMGPIAYYPEEGFPNYYFPYLNQLGYRSPLVAVHFERPTNNVLLRIVCKAWAKNIEHNLDPLWLAGVAKFEILVDGRLPH